MVVVVTNNVSVLAPTTFGPIPSTIWIHSIRQANLIVDRMIHPYADIIAVSIKSK
jgi:hypothetical protein